MGLNHSTKQSGFSLIEILVVIAIMSIVGLSMTSMMSNMNKDFRSFDEKMNLQSTQTILSSLLSNPDYCRCFFNLSTLNYSTNPKQWNDFPTTFPAAFDSLCNPVGSPILSVGVATGVIKPTSINIPSASLTEVNSATGQFSAKIEVAMDRELLSQSRKNLSMPVYFNLNMTDPASARRVASCSPPGGSFQLGTPVILSVFGSNSTSTLPNQYKFCTLSEIRTSGNGDGTNSRCTVSYQSWSQNWRLQSIYNDGDGPGLICSMTCFP